MKTPLGVGVIGVGAMGRIHAENLALQRIAGARLSAVADANEEAAFAVASHLGADRCYTSASDLLADADVAAVVIAAPRRFHAPLIAEAAAAAKHVFCEKPLAETSAQCSEALRAADQAGVVLQVGFQRRFDPDFLRLHEAVASGRTGRLQLLHLISRDPAPPDFAGRRAEDLVLETTSHDFDMARWTTGSEPRTVFAAGLPAKEAGLYNGAIFALQMESGAIVTIDNHLACAYGYDQRAEAMGTAGAVFVDNELRDTARIANDRGFTSAPPLDFFAERYQAAYAAEMQAFVRSVMDGSEPPVSGSDGLRAVRIAEAALASLRSGAPEAIS